MGGGSHFADHRTEVSHTPGLIAASEGTVTPEVPLTPIDMSMMWQNKPNNKYVLSIPCVMSVAFRKEHIACTLLSVLLSSVQHQQVLWGHQPVWLDDFHLACQTGETNDNNFIIQYLPMYLT
jgi:hypothetical protein